MTKPSKQKWIAENWERVLFVIIGLAFVGASLTFTYQDRTTDAGVVFGLGFLSFLYANVARFKRFKGLGFEAELWEDKKKEAEGLIQRLRAIISIYSRELLVGRVSAGRMDSAADWRSHWKLFEDLAAQHDDLLDGIDLSEAKQRADDYFLFDMTYRLQGEAKRRKTAGIAEASAKIASEFGNPITDPAGYARRMEQVNVIAADEIERPFQFGKKADLAGEVLASFSRTQRRLKNEFGVDIALEPDHANRLEAISALYRARPVKVTDENIEWAKAKL